MTWDGHALRLHRESPAPPATVAATALLNLTEKGLSSSSEQVVKQERHLGGHGDAAPRVGAKPSRAPDLG
jgi:hypothetical protein